MLNPCAGSGQDSSEAGLGSDGMVEDSATDEAGVSGAADLGAGPACDPCAAASPVDFLDAAAAMPEQGTADFHEGFEDASASTFALNGEEEQHVPVQAGDREYKQLELEQLVQADMEEEMSESPCRWVGVCGGARASTACAHSWREVRCARWSFA